MGLLDTLLAPIENLFNRIFAGTVVGKLVSKISQGVSHVLTLLDRIDRLVASIKEEIAAFSNWKEDIRFKSRVINLPKAVEKTRDLVTGLKTAWTAILDLVSSLRDVIKGGGDPKAEAEELAADAGDLENIGSRLLAKLPKLGKLFEKMLGVVTLIVDAIIQWSDMVDELQTVVDQVKRIRLEIESLESVFLSQKNPRRTLQLKDGSSIKIRVGNLHS